MTVITGGRSRLLRPLTMEKGSFKVIIIGASVTGLTLAHCLHRAGIDYVVLEKHVEVHPPIGAAVAILPNGARIMEQLGIFHHVERKSSSIQRVHLCFQDGFYYDSLSPSVIFERWFHSYQCIPHSLWGVKLTTCRSGSASSSHVWRGLNFWKFCIRPSRTNQRFSRARMSRQLLRMEPRSLSPRLPAKNSKAVWL